MTTSNKRRLYAVGAVLAVVLIIGGLALLTSDKKSDDKGVTTVDTGSHFDPASGETVSNPKGKTPDKFGTLQDAPTFLGVSSLLDYGVELDQVNDLKYGLYTYFKTNNIKVNQVSVVVDTVSPEEHDRDSSSTVFTIDFNIMVDSKTPYKVKMDYFDITSAQIYISDTSGVQLYDSGVLDGKSI